MGENKCSHFKCQLDIYKDNNKCILHCEKNIAYDAKDKEIYEDFHEALIDNIAQQLEESSNNDDAIINKQSAIQVLNGELFQVIFPDDGLRGIAENTFFNVMNFDYIIFPPRKRQDKCDYEQVLMKLKVIHFDYCEFNTLTLELDKISCFFTNCIFLVEWICPPVSKWDRKETIYQACIFKGKVSNYSSIDRNEISSIYTVPLFDYLCTFEKEMAFNNTKFKKPFFYSSVEQSRENKSWLEKLSFKNCIFEDVFKLNKCEDFDFICKDTTFSKKSKFEFKDNKVEKFELENSNFKVLVDCFNTEFKSFKVEKSIFEKFTGFEECKFGEEQNNSKKSTFKYATF